MQPLKWLTSWSLVIEVVNGISQNEDFACYKPPSVTLVSFGCCVLLAVSLTGWCRWLVGGAFTCVHCWYFSLFVRNWYSSCLSPSNIQTGKIAVNVKRLPEDTIPVNTYKFLENKHFFEALFLYSRPLMHFASRIICIQPKNPSLQSVCSRQPSSRLFCSCTSHHPSSNISAAYWPHSPSSIPSFVMCLS